MLAFEEVERRRWQEWAIVASILALAVVGFLAIWGEGVSKAWDRAPAEESGPALPGTQGEAL